MVYRGPTLELGLRTFLRFASICAARSAGLEPATFSVRSQTHSWTGGDREGHGETKPRFYKESSSLRGTQRDRERHPVAVRLRSKRGAPQTGLRARSRRRFRSSV